MNFEESFKEYVILVELGKQRGLNKEDHRELYLEKHHIIPRCIGGEDKDSNYVLLTYAEHIRAHFLLTFLYPDDIKISYAYHMVCNSSGHASKDTLLDPDIKYEFSEEELDRREEIRKKVSESARDRFLGKKYSEEHRKKISLAKIGEKNPQYGKHRTEEEKKHLSEMMKAKGWRGEKHPRYGVHQTEEEKAYLSMVNKARPMTEKRRKQIQELIESNRGRKLTEEQRRKISEAQRGKKRGPHSEEHRKRIAQALTGKHLSEEHKKKVSDNSPNNKKVQGPDGTVYKSLTECAKELGIGRTTIRRWVANPEKGFKLLEN